MGIDINVEKVANLAKLSLSDNEKVLMESELAAIIGFADKLSEIDTDGVEITAHIVPVTNVLRDDNVTNQPNREALLANAPTKAAGCMTVPKTFE